jgi:multidrug resistance efflux pump
VNKRVASQQELDAARAGYTSLAAALREAQDKIAVAEGEVVLENARRNVALAEVDEAELRLKQLRDRLK